MARDKTKLPLFFLLSVLSGVALYAQNADTPLWRQALGGAVIGRPVAQVESVVAATDGGNLRSCSSRGNFLWDYFAGGRLTPHVSRSREGTSYIGRTNGVLIAVNRSGRELWRLSLRSPLVSPVIIGWDGRLFAFTDRKITCMTSAGYILWSRTLEAKLALAPLRDVAGGIIALQENGELLRFDPFGNVFSSMMVSQELPEAFTSLEIPGYGLSILLLFGGGRLELVYVSSGERESLKGKLDLPAAPLAASGINSGAFYSGQKDEVAVLLKDGRVALISPEKRTMFWTEASGLNAGDLSGNAASGGASLLFDERGIYVISRNGAAGFAADGRRLWTIRLTGAAAVPSFGDDGILYSGGADWILYAYRLEDRVRAKQRLLYGEASEGDYGTGTPGPSSQADYHFRFDEDELGERFAEIRGAIKAGTVGAHEKEYAAWLMEVAGSVLADPLSGNHPPVHTFHRAEAAELLAYIGSGETIPFLSDLFSRDSEAPVKAAAARAIGKIGVDPEGIALRAFESAVFPPLALTDESVLSAAASGVGALCRFSGPPLSDAGVRILTVLAGYDSYPLVRSQAQSELRALKN